MPKGNIRGYSKAGFKGRGKARGRRGTTHGAAVRAVARAPLGGAVGKGTRGSLVRAVARKR